VLNTIQFHSPLKTGYDFWFGRWAASTLFSPRYVPNNAALLWREFALQPQPVSVATYFGTGTFFVTAFVLLLCIGVFFVRLDRFLACALLSGLSYFAVTLTYKFSDVRFYLPLLVLLVAVAVLPVTWAAENIVVKRRSIGASIILLLFIAACLGYPSRSADNPRVINRSQAWEALHFTKRPRQSIWFNAQKQFVQMFRAQPGIVLADINPVYLNALLPASFVAAPLDEKRYVGFQHVMRYDRAQKFELVRRSLIHNRPVYALFVSRKEMDEKTAQLPVVEGYEWVTAETSAREILILKLNITNK